VALSLRQLRNGNIKSCGCLSKPGWRGPKTDYPERVSASDYRRAKSSWHNMIVRCTNPKTRSYRDYGARGITVCDEWSSFSKFFEDMGPPPAGYQLDRLDNDGNYQKSNCRWATPRQQASNRRTSKMINYSGERRCLGEWCHLFQVNYNRAYNRMQKSTDPAYILFGPSRTPPQPQQQP